jgi:23S rRNA (cytosine1962-C5)-methyltransferase
LARVEGRPADGDLIDLVADQGRFLARGIFNSASRIRVRLYTWNADEMLDAAFWRRRIEAAVCWRTTLGFDDREGAARLIFSDSDGLSGLIVDRFGEYLVVQLTARAMWSRLEDIVPPLVELCRPRGVLVRVDREAAAREGLAAVESVAYGTAPDGPVFIREHGIRYGVDLAEGQKTGCYLDQRENRQAAARYMRGRRVLDVCCYAGGFSLAASMLGGAVDVLGIDGSAKAIALARAHAELNGVANVRFETGDCFRTLEALGAEGRRFDAIILDPPKFAGKRDKVDAALRAYHRLNRLAVEALSPDGILVTCSCSGHVLREDFAHMLSGVAQEAGREVIVLEQRGAAPDHAVSATCWENEYLKCFICRVV